MDKVKIKISHALKQYGNNVIIPDLSVVIEEGEFFTLLGPSGCGKTTLLRMIAGFNTIEGGDFYFNDQKINDLAPEKRNIGMVFQNYAIFPHLTVKKNVAFGLQNRKLPKDQIEERTQKFLGLMKIEEYQDRLPERLSGGQQQRVALARALAIEPSVLLMDEPLSNLDAKLRVEMREVIKEIQNKLGITTVYVTHDQEEAMAVSDRIAVMNQGVIQQIGTPQEVFDHPANIFVAGFIGSPQMNFFDAELVRSGDGYSVSVNGVRFSLSEEKQGLLRGRDIPQQEITLGIRPEHITVGEEGIPAMVDLSEMMGTSIHLHAAVNHTDVVVVVPTADVQDKGRSAFTHGMEVKLEFGGNVVHLFDKENGENLCL